jgi:undecaprenyl-diphosphatase
LEKPDLGCDCIPAAAAASGAGDIAGYPALLRGKGNRTDPSTSLRMTASFREIFARETKLLAPRAPIPQAGVMDIVSWFHALDLRLLHLINLTWSRPWLDPVMALLSDYDSWRWPIRIAAVLALVLGGFRGRQMVILMAACLLIGDGMIDWGFKLAIHRPRPMETVPGLRVVSVHDVHPSQPHPTSRGRSFTSGHACNNVALAFVACAIFGRWAAFFWPWAALVSYSRVYCAAHYPSDIFGSWIVAITYSYFIVKGAEWLWQRFAPRRAPRLYASHPRLFPRMPWLIKMG